MSFNISPSFSFQLFLTRSVHCSWDAIASRLSHQEEEIRLPIYLSIYPSIHQSIHSHSHTNIYIYFYIDLYILNTMCSQWELQLQFNTTGWILAFGFSTFGTPFSSSEKSGSNCSKFIYLFAHSSCMLSNYNPSWLPSMLCSLQQPQKSPGTQKVSLALAASRERKWMESISIKEWKGKEEET